MSTCIIHVPPSKGQVSDPETGKGRPMAQRLSRLLLPTLKESQLPSNDGMSPGLRMLLRAGYIRRSSSGIYALLPLASRLMDKIQLVIDDELARIDASRCSLPCLQPASLWGASGRLASMKDAMYRVKEDDLVLAPTHEEEVTRLVAETITSRHRLPLRLYQFGPKFRREARPKGGLLRLREFVMKDMYSFDLDGPAAEESYRLAQLAYERIFTRLGLPFVCAEASCGDMGGRLSHEYHLVTEVGEDTLHQCSVCGRVRNGELKAACCSGPHKTVKGLELGHTFLLGTKYSEALGATVKDSNGDRKPLEMGCYGIGVSRLVAAMAETMSDSLGLVWPEEVAPYRLLITAGQEMGEADLQSIAQMSDALLSMNPTLKGSILIDDRAEFSLPYRLKDAQLIGVPTVLVLGRQFQETGQVEKYTRCTGSFSRADVHQESMINL